MSAALLARVEDQGTGTTSGAATADLLTVDLDSINPAFDDGTVMEVLATYIASMGASSRTIRHRYLLEIASGQCSLAAQELIGSSLGDVALVAVSTGVSTPASQRKFIVQATGVILLSIDWGVVVETTLYLAGS